MNDSCFLVSRSIFDNGLWKNQLKFRLFLFIFGNALFDEKGKKYGDINIKRGQFLRSYRNLREDLEFIENHAVKKPSLSQLSRTIDELVEEERIKTELTDLGTLFTVLNYESYQQLINYKKDSIEQRKNTDGTEMERIKNNNKNVKNVKENKEITIAQNPEIEITEKSLDLEECFNFFWSNYPRKVGKEEARKVWRKLSLNENLFNEIMIGLDRYVKNIQSLGTQEKYIKHPGPWLNAKRWLDVYETETSSSDALKKYVGGPND